MRVDLQVALILRDDLLDDLQADTVAMFPLRVLGLPVLLEEEGLVFFRNAYAVVF